MEPSVVQKSRARLATACILACVLAAAACGRARNRGVVEAEEVARLRGEVAGLVAEAAAEVVGPDAVGPALASLGGDDFAFLLQRAPGCYFFLGERQQGRAAYGWHDPAYDLDEASIAVGSAVLALAALRAVERRSA